MHTININRHQLLAKIKANRSNHVRTFEKAQEGYRKKCIEELDRMLAEAKAGQPIRRALELPEPQNHEDDYERVILMLEMSEDAIIAVSAGQFENYVMDKWAWSGFAETVSAMYVGD